jgi:AmiR/NasT family two-component response regulator
MTLLIVTANDAAALQAGQDLAAGLEAAGLPVVGPAPCPMLVREVVRLAPLGVILLVSGWDAPLQAALDLLASSAPRPVLVVGAAEWPTDHDLLIRSHVMAWLPGPVHPTMLSAAWALARARFDHEQALRAAVAAAEARLDERKWVDRAKGVLMRHQQLSELDAFALLRTASMQANLRVGEVSRGLIEAAQAADAVNRAGQLRMLSQRFVKGLVLRGLPRPRPDDQLAETAQRLQANLDHLASLPLAERVAAQLAGARAAWLALQACSGDEAASRSPGGAAWLSQLDEAERRAEALLAEADLLTTALEAASGRRKLQVINLCGRQRMLSQRLAKQALLAAVLPDAAAAAQMAAAVLTVQAFEAGLLALEQAPLASEGIRAALAQARGQWHRLLDGQRRAGGGDAVAGRAALARESDALSTSFDQLTSLYEHSMQVLLG